MTRWREVLLIGVLFGALILFTIYGPGRTTPGSGDLRGSAHSLEDEGTYALQRWLANLGYRATNLESADWQLPTDSHALLIIAAVKRPILEREADEILRWVRDGGTLIAIDERPQLQLAPNRLWQELGASTVVSGTIGADDVAERASATQPLLISPPAQSIPVHTNRALRLDAPDYVTLLETEFGPTLIGRQEGRGYVYLGVAAHPFTNEGLREPDSGALMLNLLARVPAGGAILFDEYHHGFGQAAAAAPSLRRIVTSTWWGWAILYAVGVVTLYLVLTGRRFGRPVPVSQELARRSSAEYVQSMAHLLQRAGKRGEIGLHFHDRLKRRLARQYGIAPTVDDDTFLRHLINASGATDARAESLRSLLGELRRQGLRETELVRVVRSLDELVDPRGRLR